MIPKKETKHPITLDKSKSEIMIEQLTPICNQINSKWNEVIEFESEFKKTTKQANAKFEKEIARLNESIYSKFANVCRQFYRHTDYGGYGFTKLSYDDIKLISPQEITVMVDEFISLNDTLSDMGASVVFTLQEFCMYVGISTGQYGYLTNHDDDYIKREVEDIHSYITNNLWRAAERGEKREKTTAKRIAAKKEGMAVVDDSIRQPIIQIANVIPQIKSAEEQILMWGNTPETLELNQNQNQNRGLIGSGNGGNK